MRVFGIDPGSNATGYAVLSREAGRTVLHEAGVVRTKGENPVPERLLRIHQGLTEAMDRLQPDAVAIEAIFRHRSSESALRLGQARGVALLVAAQHGLPVAEYNPSTVKKSVTGYGHADKAQVAALVGRLIGRTEPLAADASDAVAIALTHLAQGPLQALLAQARR